MKKKLMIGCSVICIYMSGLVKADGEDVQIVDDTSHLRLTAETQKDQLKRVFWELRDKRGFDILNELKKRHLTNKKYPKETLELLWLLYIENHPKCSYKQFLKMFMLQEIKKQK